MSPASSIRQPPGQWLDEIAARLRAHPWVSDASTGTAGARPGNVCAVERLPARVVPSAEGVRALRTSGKSRLASELQRWLHDGGFGDAPALDLRLAESLLAEDAGTDAGPRRWMPIVADVARDARGVGCELRVPYDLPIFRGHFPDKPIVPGVLQVGWAATMSRDHGLAEGPLTGIPAAKFNRLVRPGMRLLARIELGPTAGQVQFRYTYRDAAVTTGRLQFGVPRD